jgi:2-polyprenyl-3-methyl-5-hydroxy-6-metoxy-1,4-benzoquinol methylase
MCPETHRACAACGADEAIVCHRQKFVVPDGYPLPSEYNVLACRRCGFVYADPAATQKDYDYFYSEWSKYDDANTSTGGGISPYDAARLAATAADLARALPSTASVLDVGCATGGMLAALRDGGFSSVTGLDPSERCVVACRHRGFSAYIGTLNSALASMPKFDCILFSHVLEHVYDVPAFFTAIQRLIVPGGYIYLETPDASRYVDYLSSPFQEFNSEHINHFSTRALKNTARRFGFSAVRVEQKLLQISDGIEYPAVFGIFRDLGIAAKSSDVIRDPDLPAKIEAYLQASSIMLEQINLHLAAELKSTKSVILWGAGQLAMKLLALPCFEHIAIRTVVDNNPVLRGKTIRGAQIVAPAEIANSHEPIVISTLLHANDIAAQIDRLGMQNSVILVLPGSATGASWQ